MRYSQSAPSGAPLESVARDEGESLIAAERRFSRTRDDRARIRIDVGAADIAARRSTGRRAAN